MTKRIPIMAANWKMHKVLREAESYAAEFPLDQDLYRQVEVVICPAFTSLQVVAKALRGTGIKLGAQNMHPAEQGAFTGEVSPVMLKDLGCSYVILGHSERRHLFGESDRFINQKVVAALRHRLIPILCVGETLAERKAGQTEEVCAAQLSGSLAGLSGQELTGIVIAYEPVWAIGTGVNATAGDAETTIRFIRSFLTGQFGEKAGEAVRIQYGGSVKPDNVQEYMKQEDIDGALVGGAGLSVDSFFSIIQGALVKLGGKDNAV